MRKIRIMRRKILFAILALSFCSIWTLSVSGIDKFLFGQASLFWHDMSQIRKNGGMKTILTNTNRISKAENHVTYFGCFAPVFGQDG